MHVEPVCYGTVSEFHSSDIFHYFCFVRLEKSERIYTEHQEKGRLRWRWGPNILNNACPQRVFGCLELTLEKVPTG